MNNFSKRIFNLYNFDTRSYVVKNLENFSESFSEFYIPRKYLNSYNKLKTLGFSKENCDKYMHEFLDNNKFEVKDSPIGGRGVFAKIPIKKGTKIKAITLFDDASDEFNNYYWMPDRKIIAGIGYLANGSCDRFNKLKKMGIKKVGPFNVTESNIKLSRNYEYFIFTKDLKPGDEVILNYSDLYFYPILTPKGIDYTIYD